MRISGLQKLSLLDYPSKVACIVFTQGCNFKCSYCHNSDLIKMESDNELMLEDVFNYLNKRKDVLDGVVISGGEPTLQTNLKDFIKKIKELGLLVKLDTNGTNPNLLQKLIDEKLLDYVAMDIKSDFDNYPEVIKTKLDVDKIKKSVDILRKSKVDHEFRTTLIKNLHDFEKINNICEYLDGEVYYLQNFKQSERVIDKQLISFEEAEIKLLYETLKKKFPNLRVRGI